MKVLVVHNSYQQYGGEDVAVSAETDLLGRHGNLARLHLISNNSISGFSGRLGAAIGVAFSLSGYRSARKLLRRVRPDVVHVHNFFPLISPSVFYACRAEGVPTVFTLHNYRIICPTAILMHEGEVTERSLHEGPWWALRHRVYRGSLVGTFLLCLMIAAHRRIGTWRNTVDRFIVLSEFARARFLEAGLPADSLAVKPNFVDVPAPADSPRSGLLFVGRLSSEKGISTLLAAAERMGAKGRHTAELVAIAGAGPLADVVAHGKAQYLGALAADVVGQHMRSAMALLIPSTWYEGFPMVLVEAYANGLPVIASRIGALAELVEDGVTGLLFDPGNEKDLATKMTWALDHPAEMRRMGRVARERYDALYTPDRNYEQLMAIYREAIEHNKRRQK